MIKKRLFYTIAIPILITIAIATLLLAYLVGRPIAADIKENLTNLLQHAAFMSVDYCDASYQHLLDLRLESDRDAVNTAKKDSIDRALMIPSMMNQPMMKVYILSEDMKVVSGPPVTGVTKFGGTSGEGSVYLRSGNDNIIGYYYYFPPWRWYVIAGMPESFIAERLSFVKDIIYIGMFALVSIMATVMFLIVRHRILRPLKAISDITERIRGGSFERIPLEEANSYEMESLALSFNSMVNALEGRTRELKTAFEEVEKFKLSVESAFDMILITNMNKEILYVNPAFQRATGYSMEDVIGKDPKFLRSEKDDTLDKEIADAIKAGRVWKGEFKNRKKDGSIYIASANICPLYDTDKLLIGFVSVQRDITEEKKLYEHLVTNQKLEAIGTLAGGIAHDFKNILTPVLGYAELLKGKVETDSPFYRPLSLIEESARRGAELSERILSFTRKEELIFRKVSINEVIRSAIEIFGNTIEKNIIIETTLDEGLPLVKVDGAQIEQAIMNLFINARDAMQQGGGRLTIKTSMATTEKASAINRLKGDNACDYVLLSVSDTGIGMDEETKKRAFEPFFTTKGSEKGTGLGLFMVYKAVVNNGGHIDIYSELGKGTEFELYFPIVEENNRKGFEEEVRIG